MMKRNISNACAGILLAASLIGGCATLHTTSGGTVGVERRQTMMVSSEEVNKAAAQAYQEVIAEARQKNLLNRNSAQVQRVRRITDRLVAQTPAFREDALKWPWEIHVITSNEINAWVMPGGKMAVYTGLIEKLNLTDDELAIVIGHEIAHALREHGREKVSQAAGVGTAAAVGGAIIGAVTGLGDVGTRAGRSVLSTVGDLAFMRPNSRVMEQEADRIGVELAARAGFNPRAAISFWEKIDKISSGSPPQWLSTHPSYETRMADLRVYAERVMPLYEAARQRR